MMVRIGISESREIEIEVEDEQAFRDSVNKGFLEDPLPVLWVTDTKGRSVGIPIAKVSYVEIDPGDERMSVGFSS